jgi:tetratricopeptide (TPR) repeat protein
MDINKTLDSTLQLLKAGNLDKAEETCKEILRMQPDNVDALHFLGVAYYQHKEYDSAITYIEKALQVKPDYVDAYNDLGLILRDKGQLDDAVSCFRRALEINPNFAEPCVNLGNVLQAKGALEEAIIYYERAIRLSPDNAEVYFHLALIYQQKGRFEEAVNCCSKMFEINPGNTKVYYVLGTIFLSVGQVDKCLDCYRKFLRIEPDAADAFLPSELSLEKKDIHKPDEFGSYTDGSILICVSAYNRKEITRLSLEQTKRYKGPGCYLQVYDDHSTEYHRNFLEPYADEVVYLPHKMGIHNMRMHQFRKFLETNFDYLYMTDNDIIHDPSYVSVLKALYEAGNRRLPVCLFNSRVHMVPDNILLHKNGIILKRLASGVSMFYDRRMVEKIVSRADKANEDHEILAWDYRVMAYLNLPWITSETSYLEHFGSGGIHNYDNEMDRALNPTRYLQERRKPILDYLTGGGELHISF